MEAEVEQLLAWLQSQGYLNEERFVESRLHLRSQRFGSLRIKQELAQHGLALSSEQAQGLREAELPRAMEIRRRKFGEALPADAAGRAKQTRFLAARGFSADVIRKALKDPD
nr:RecX family transcriptional regulator [Pelomonas sp. V22]